MMLHFDSFVAVEKEVLRRRGVITSSAIREPSVPLDREALAGIGFLLQKIGLEDASSNRVPRS